MKVRKNVSGGDVSKRSHQGTRPPARALVAPVAQSQVADATDAWRLEPHVCRACFSRLVSRQADDGHRLYQCTNCGAEASGHGPDVLCSCGLKIRRSVTGSRSGLALIDAGVRCTKNPDPRPDFPSLFVAAEAKHDC